MDGNSSFGDLNTISQIYIKALISKVLKQYDAAVANWPDDRDYSKRVTFRIRVDTDAGQATAFDFSSNISDRRRLLLIELYQTCSRQMKCPEELRRLGRFVEFESDLGVCLGK